MSDFEITYLFAEAAADISRNIMNSFAVATTYIVIGYYMSGNLRRNLIAIITAIYTFVATLMTIATLTSHNTFTGLVRQMKIRIAEGSDLAWHGAASLSDAVLQGTYYVLILILIGTYIGTVYFFVSFQRNEAKRNSKA